MGKGGWGLRSRGVVASQFGIRFGGHDMAILGLGLVKDRGYEGVKKVAKSG